MVWRDVVSSAEASLPSSNSGQSGEYTRPGRLGHGLRL